MKAVEEVVACVCDYGTFICVAEKLAERMATVYYHSPCESEFQNIRACVKGYGLEKVKRLDDPLDPDVLKKIDLFVFPDIGMSGLQRHLRDDCDKAVWGHLGATELELYRDLFLRTVEEVGLPVVKSERIEGLSALADYLRENDHKWIKVNRYRDNMDTWKHYSYRDSERMLERMAILFGGAQEHVVFIAQDEIETELEVGYDGWCIDGLFPVRSFQGYEKKNELSLNSWHEDTDLPDEIKVVNEAMAPILASYGYRCWWSTEVRIADGEPYFIDPTARMAGLECEQQLETCTNIAEIIWEGANGNILEPDFAWKFAAAAIVHYDAPSSVEKLAKEWISVELPSDVFPWLKLYYHCRYDKIYHFVGDRNDELGVMVGVDDSTEEAIDHLKENLDLLKDLPVHAEVKGFAELLESIKEAEKQGVKFGGKIPKPASVL